MLRIKKREIEGRLLVFEGVDAVGKSTLCQAVHDELDAQKIDHEMLSFPGREAGTIGELVYRVHHHHAEDFSIDTIDPLSLQTLHIASHIDLINSKIRPKLLNGCWIVLDRFWWSTYVYGIYSGIPTQQIEALVQVEKLVWGDCVPDLLVLMDSKAPLRNDEQGDAAWHKKRNLYHALAEQEKGPYEITRILNDAGSSDYEQENSDRARSIVEALCSDVGDGYSS